MTDSVPPRVLIIAGPNGAGKTTFANEFLPAEANCPRFINADLIAAGLSPFRPEAVAFRAGRLVLEQITAFVRQKQSFAFETTLSGRGYARLIAEWRVQGYFVELFFLRLPDADFAISRVRQRVAEGGHAVPEPVIRRRFKAGWRNFEILFRPIVNAWAVYDNSGVTPHLIAKGVNP
ncbi:MAG: Zeta toxin family protein [Pseudomonadota bacterium]|nr:Zeta toxin family protein [Pseudomonadota bacterium]